MPSTIRVATAADGAATAAIYAPIVRDTAISFEVDPPDAAEMARRIEETSRRYPWLVADRDGEAIGYVYAGPHRARAAYGWSVETTVYLHEEARGRGVGRALYRSLLALLELQGAHAAYAGITLPNEASVGLHEALDFALVGVYREVGWKLGAWHDVGWWHLPLAAHDAAPAELRPFAELATVEGYSAALSAGEAELRS